MMMMMMMFFTIVVIIFATACVVVIDFVVVAVDFLLFLFSSLDGRYIIQILIFCLCFVKVILINFNKLIAT